MTTLVTARELAERHGVHRRTAYRWIEQPDFPAPMIRSSAGALWDTEEVDEWVRSTAEERGGYAPRSRNSRKSSP